MNRFFRCASDAIYEQARAELDAAWNLPNESIKTDTCLTPASAALRDKQSRILFAVDAQVCDWPPMPDLLARHISAGIISEISSDAFFASIPSSASP